MAQKVVRCLNRAHNLMISRVKNTMLHSSSGQDDALMQIAKGQRQLGKRLDALESGKKERRGLEGIIADSFEKQKKRKESKQSVFSQGRKSGSLNVTKEEKREATSIVNEDIRGELNGFSKLIKIK